MYKKKKSSLIRQIILYLCFFVRDKENTKMNYNLYCLFSGRLIK